MYKLRSISAIGVCEFDLEEFVSIVNRPCFYCGSPPNRTKKAFNKHVDSIGNKMHETANFHGIDRIDSSASYVKSNIVTCCKECNSMKSDMNIKDFLDQINKIHEHNRVK